MSTVTRRMVLMGAVAQLSVSCAGGGGGAATSDDLALCQNLSRAIFRETWEKVSATKDIARRAGITLGAAAERAEIERVLDYIRQAFDLGGFAFAVSPGEIAGADRRAWDVRFSCRAGRSTTRATLTMAL